MISSRGPIGIDITARTIIAVQTVMESGRPCIMATVSLPRAGDGEPFNAAEARDLAGVLDRKQFKGRSIVVAVPAENVMMDVFRVPSGAGQTLETAAADTLARAHRCSPETFEHACWSVPGRSESPLAVAVGCGHEQAGMLLDALEAARFRVAALDVMPLALVRACRPVLDEITDVSIITHLDWGAASLSLVRDGVVTFQRTLPELGIERVAAAMEATFDDEREVVVHVMREVGLESPPADSPMRSELMSDARRILVKHITRIGDELRRSLEYVRQEFDSTPVGRILAVGEGARLPGVGACLGKAAGVDVQIVKACDVAKSTIDLEAMCDTPLLCPALGLAMYPRGNA